MFKRPKPPLWPHRSAGFLDPWPSSSDRVLHAVLHSDAPSLRFDSPEAVESDRERRALSNDDHIAIAVLSLLGTSGVLIGWALFVQ